MAREDRSRLTWAWAAAAALLAAAAARAQGRGPERPASLKVCVYYDGASTRPGYVDGRLHAIMLENLLGHFREASVTLSEAGTYRAGGLDACDRAAYMGSDFSAALPPAFLKDVAAYGRRFLWINYGIAQLQQSMGADAFRAKAGFTFLRLRGFDHGAPEGQVPGFFRDFEYKGARFNKMAYVNPDGTVVAAPELALVQASSATVLATAVHTDGAQRTPYVLEKGGFYFVGDNPFIYIHERDRYLIVADLLFDFLGLPPREKSRWALVRLEDVHPSYDLALLDRSIRLLKARGVPFAITVIPRFVAAGAPEDSGVSLLERPELVAALRFAQRSGGDLLLHGYTHSAPGLPGCPSLASGADFEFWDRCSQRALPYDSKAFARARIERAKETLSATGLRAIGWVTPHYAASAADFAVFAREFDRTVGRVRYEAGDRFVSQFFPYTIYRDHYGQFVWPEDLGFVPMPGATKDGAGLTDLAEAAKANMAVRDAWASFFWHPQLVKTPAEVDRLERVIDAIRGDGYTFVALKDLKARGE